jgi:MFS family permease
LYFVGQAISLVGTWVQQTALSWLVYRLTRSVFLLGLVSFAAQIPNFFLNPLAGVFADRWNRRLIIIGTQTALMLQASLLAGVGHWGSIQVWHIIALNIFFGIASSIDIPVRQSFMVEMLESRGDLPNAIALNATMVMEHGSWGR